MHKKVFEQAGLSEEQAKIYSILLDKGALTAKRVSIISGFKRGLVYKILDQLEAIELIEKEVKKGASTKFSPGHPKTLEKIITNKKQEVDQSASLLESILPELTASFNVSMGKPNVQTFEGISGLKHLYADIVKTKKKMKLIRSAKDVSDPIVQELIKEAIESQNKAGIHVALIGPFNPESTLENDIRNNVTRRYFEPADFTLPAQIVLYGDKVAITSFDDTMLTTIIDSTTIRQTMESIFELLWKQGKPQFEE